MGYFYYFEKELGAVRAGMRKCRALIGLISPELVNRQDLTTKSSRHVAPKKETSGFSPGTLVRAGENWDVGGKGSVRSARVSNSVGGGASFHRIAYPISRRLRTSTSMRTQNSLTQKGSPSLTDGVYLLKSRFLMSSWELVWTGQPAKPCRAGSWSELVNQLNRVELGAGLNWSTS